MINELEKDKAAIVKDIGSLAAQVSLKHKELKDLDSLISETKDQLARDRQSKDWTLASLDKQTKEKENRLLFLEQEITSMNKKKNEQTISIKKEIDSLVNQKIGLQKDIQILDTRLEDIVKKSSEAESELSNLADEVKKMDAVALEKKEIIENLCTLSSKLLSQVRALESREEELKGVVAAIEKRQLDLDEYHSQLRREAQRLEHEQFQLSEASEKTIFLFEKSAERSRLPIKRWLSPTEKI